MSKQYYMYITDSPDRYWIESYTKYITTVEGFADMLISEDFFKDRLDSTFQEVQSFSFSQPDENGGIKVRITGVDWCHDVYTIERGLIPVNIFG